MHSVVQGRLAEDKALEYLKQQGLKLIVRNYRCKMGEIDLIMRDPECLVFAEVRFRSYRSNGGSIESVTFHKQQKIIKAALHFLRYKNLHDKVACRFDVIAMDNSKIEWIKDAFQADNFWC